MWAPDRKSGSSVCSNEPEKPAVRTKNCPPNETLCGSFVSGGGFCPGRRAAAGGERRRHGVDVFAGPLRRGSREAGRGGGRGLRGGPAPRPDAFELPSGKRVERNQP